MTLEGVRRERPPIPVTFDFPNVGLGHLIDFDPLLIPAGYSQRTYDCNLDTLGSAVQRGGAVYEVENGACGLQIASCQEGAGWDAFSTVDAAIFRQFKYSALGVSARRITTVGQEIKDSVFTFPQILDLGNDLDEYIPFWVYVDDKTRILQFGISISSKAATFADSFSLMNPVVPPANGWNFILKKKSDFVSQGAPVWTDTHAVLIRLSSLDSTFVVYDNIWLGVAHIYGHYNFRRSAAKGGGNWLLAAGRDKLDVLVPEERRWKTLRSGLARKKVVNFLTMNDFCYAFNGVDKMMLIVDNNTLFDAGIEKAASLPNVEVLPGQGNVVAGTHSYAFAYWSDITSRDNDPVFLDNVVVAATGSAIKLTNLPQSPDPKVSGLLIYRLAPGQPGWKRLTGQAPFDVAKGVAEFTDTAASTSLGKLLDGSPAYDTKQPPPRARVGCKVRAHGIVDIPEAQGQIWVGRANTMEQWAFEGKVALDEGDNDDVRGAASIFGHAGIFMQDAIYVGRYHGLGLQPLSWKKEVEDIGTTSHRSILVRGGRCWWKHTNGWYTMLADLDPQKISRGWDESSRMTLAEPSLKQLENRAAQLVTAAYLTSRDQIYWSDTKKGESYPSVQPVLHEVLEGYGHLGAPGGWAFHRAPVSTILRAREPSTHNEVLYGWGAAGILFRLDQEPVFDRLVQGDQTIDFDLVTVNLDRREASYGLGPEKLKFYHAIAMLMRSRGNWPMDVELYWDWDLVAKDVLQLDPTSPIGAGIGDFSIGESVIGGPAGVFASSRISPGRHRSVAIRFRNNRKDEAGYVGPFILYESLVRADVRTG